MKLLLDQNISFRLVNKITEHYQRVGKVVKLKHLSSDCVQLLKNADDLIDVNMIEDPTYKVVTDEL